MLASCDVLVVGGGVAGTAAAVSAARQGARTVLAERESFLGGIGYAGPLQQICGLYLNGESVPRETLNPGIAADIEQALSRKSPERRIRKIGQVYVLPYSSEDLQSVLRELCRCEQNLDVYYLTAAVSSEIDKGIIKKVVLRQTEKEVSLFPKIVIDCSGDAVAAALAGLELDDPDSRERQLAGFIVRVSGLKDADESLSIKVPYHLAQAVTQGRFSDSIRYTAFSLAESPGEGYVKMSVHGEEGPDREEAAKKDAVALHRYLASVLPAFKDSFIAGLSLRVLDREGRRIRGEYVLTEEDVLNARKFPDGVVKNAWPIEIWDRSKGTSYKYLPKGEYYEIPFRCLKVKGIGNLLAAGRCISVTHKALGSTRVMGTCMALGDAAGKAAAYFAKTGEYSGN